MREVQAAYLYGGLTYVALAAVLLLNGWGLLGLLVATFARELIARNYCRRVYHAAVPKVSALQERPDKEILKRLWPNASKLGVLSIGTFLLSNGSVLISGQLKDVSVTASFGLTAQIGGFLTNFAALWLVVKWPAISMLRMQGRLQEMSILFARRLAFTMGTYVVLATLVALVGNWLLALKGTHTRLLPAPLLIFYFIYLAQQLFYVQFGALAYSENVVPFFKIGILTGMGMFILSFLMTWAFGLWGMLLAPLIAESAYSSWFTVRRGFRGQPLTARELLKAAVYGHP
jgi:O-antigen/teichoic acid export membrane protein